MPEKATDSQRSNSVPEQMLKVEDALEAYAKMMNTLDAGHLKPLLAEDFHYASQWVFDEIESRSEYLEYIQPKLSSIKRSGTRAWAEMGYLDREMPGPCVVLAQGDKENLVAVALAKIKDGRIHRIDLCCVPSPHSARRTSRYPGITDSTEEI